MEGGGWREVEGGGKMLGWTRERVEESGWRREEVRMGEEVGGGKWRKAGRS